MSYADGWAAMHLEAPGRVPRTEFSADCYHWPLVNRVTGLRVNEKSPPEERRRASVAFVEAWDYGMIWATNLSGNSFGPYQYSMGHAVYAADGSDLIAPKNGGFFKEPEDVLAFDPEASLPVMEFARRVESFNGQFRHLGETFPTAVPMTGIYVTLMSGMIDLFGWDLLLAAAGEDPAGFGEVMNRYARWNTLNFKALAACASPVVMIHDDMVWTQGAFIHPDWYRQYLFPNLKRMIALLRDAGKIVLFTCDGNYTEFFDDVAACGVSGFVLEPLSDLKQLVERYGKTHVIVGNADTRILLSGSREDIRAEVKRCMDLGKPCPGFIMAVGNHIPANTPVESALYYDECYREMRIR